MSETMSLPRKASEKKVSEEGNGKALEYLAGVKVHILKDDNQDPSDLTATTYVLEKEDHTLGNAIRWMVMKDPDVQFCGYSLPHPSEDKLHLRIQTYDGKSSLKVLHEALVKLETHFTQIKDAYQEDLQNSDFERYQEAELDMEEIHRQGREKQKRKEKKEREANRSGINNSR